MSDNDEVKHVVLEPKTRDELVQLLKEDEHKHYAFKNSDGETVGVIMGATSYNFLRAEVDILEHPQKHGFKLKQLWDSHGPGLTLEQAFGEKPIPRSLALRLWFYEKRLAIYERIGIRSADTDVHISPIKLADAFFGRGEFGRTKSPTAGADGPR